MSDSKTEGDINLLSQKALSAGQDVWKRKDFEVEKGEGEGSEEE